MTDLMTDTCSRHSCPASPVVAGHARTIAVTHAGGGVHGTEDILNAGPGSCR